MHSKIVFSLKTALVTLALTVFILFLISFWVHIKMWDWCFWSCLFIGSFLYGQFAYDKMKNNILFLLLSVTF